MRGLGWGSFFCLWLSNCSSTICLKGYPLSIKMLLHFCQKSAKSIWAYFCVLHSVHWSFSMFLSFWQYCFDYCSYIVRLKYHIIISPTSFFFIKIGIAILMPMPFRINFKIGLSMSSNNFDEIVIEIFSPFLWTSVLSSWREKFPEMKIITSLSRGRKIYSGSGAWRPGFKS